MQMLATKNIFHPISSGSQKSNKIKAFVELEFSFF